MPLLHFGAVRLDSRREANQVHDSRMQIDGCRVLQLAGLRTHSLDDFGMAMPDADRDDSSQTVQVAPAAFIPDVLHLAFDDHQRIAVIGNDARRQVLMPQREDFVSRRSFVRRRLVIDDWK